MTGADEIPFGRVLRDLFAAYGKTPTPEQAESYFGGLEDLALPVIERACAAAKRSSRFCPSVRVLREAAAVERAQPMTPPLATAIREGEIHCQPCDDTGWLITTKAIPASVSLGYRTGSTLTYARPCPCRATNPLYQAKRAAERRTAGGGEA